MRHPQVMKWLAHDNHYVMIEAIKTSFDNDIFDVSLLDSGGCVEGVRAETIEEGLADLCTILEERKQCND